MVNAVMDAIALLSSLATDLDIMLNDLRSSPSTRLLPPSQHLSSSPQQRNPPQTSPSQVGGADDGSFSGNAFHSPACGQQYSATTGTTHFSRQQHVRSSAATGVQNQNRNQQQQQRHNQDCCKLHESRALHVAGSGTGSITHGSPAIGSEPHAVRSGGLSTEVRQIQKLPLWSYQQRQLQQPQKLHVQLLQRHQQATKAIATQATADAFANSKSNVVKTTMSTTPTSSMMTNSTASFYGARNNDNKNNNHGELRGSNSSWLQAATCLLRSSSDSQSTTAATATLLSSSATSASSQQQQQNHQIIQTQANQLKSSSAATAASATSPPSAGNAIVVNSNNSRRLPFCGIDSIKGSDNNGGLHIQQQQQQTSPNCGTTNLSFDLGSVVLVGSSSGNNNASTQLDTQSEQFHSMDANGSSCCGDGPFDDDMQALLPKCRLSRDELSPSRTSLVSSSDGGILAEGETSSETSRGSDECPPCDLGLVERLMLTHPVWFLPGIQRSGAVHFLQSKEEGNFIVRGSSQHNTMAVSVRLPPDTGPYIEHYLIQSNEGIISLESSRFKFNSIPALIAHYALCCDELPVQLVLPRALRDAKNRQQLSSLALLGQEFWRYPMSCPKQDETEATLLDAKSPNSLTETSGIGTTIFSNSTSSNGPQQSFQQHLQHHQQCPQPQTAPKIFSPTNNLSGMFSQAGTPSDTTSSMSSFTTSGGQQVQLMSPESVDSVILTMSPVDHLNNQRKTLNGLSGGCELNGNTPNLLSTFKSNMNSQIMPFKPNKFGSDNGVRPQRPTPPNTLNLDLRKPPAPPVRWSKPLTPNSTPLSTPDGSHPLNGPNNFTVTTTVTFSVDQSNSPQFVEVTTPSTNGLNPALNANPATFQTFSKRLSPEGECKDTLSSQGSAGSRWHSQSSKDSNNSQRHILSPCSAVTPTGVTNNKSRKAKARKESKHYQESDILESPQIYCRSNLADKFSDYEDLWSHDPSERAGLLTSFKPNLDGVQGKRPDLLAETPSITSLNCNVLSPANSSLSSASPLNASDTAPTPTADLTEDTQQLLQLSAEQSQPRSRAALLLPTLMSQSLNEDQLKSTSEGDTTPTAQTPNSRSKQGSPFYAEPADALRQAGLSASILRRSHRGALLPANHRHSEPPKGGMMRTPLCTQLMAGEIEKVAGSLDELKKKPSEQQNQTQGQYQQQSVRHGRARFEQWQLDSSWEFMSKQRDMNDNEEEDDGDYDSADHWNPQTHTSQEKESSLEPENHLEVKEKPITIHQIIAKRLPDLNLPELVRCSTPQQQQQQQQHQQPQQPHQNGSQKSIESQNGCRLSSYDNVERNLSFFNGIDSSQSDDGTVFSEPWDPSQWDSILPQDDVTLTSDSIHLSKCRPAVSEDDTIIEELSTKEHNQDTLKARKTNGRQKVATILRNPSIRDREILCHPRNKINPYAAGCGPGDAVRAYTLQLALDPSSTFARNIENFISCTKESREAAPQVVMRNMRQFMNGMKNYLVKHGEGKFQQEVEAARSRLKSDEFLNLDAILETVMHQLVVLPLREHLYGMFVDYYTRSEDIQLLAQNVKYACGRNAADFGIRASVTPPASSSLHAVSSLLLRLQEAELPLEKLDLFLCVISTIFDATGCPRGQQLGADDFLPILVYVVAKCGFVGAEIEAEFMWGLLQPTLLNGEPGYYLTALCSAVHVLKSFMASENESGTGSLDWRASSLPACSSVLRVIIPDECNGSLQTRTLPVRPHTTTREVCRIIAHKARITNPQDYALFKLVDGEETPLSESECPQDIRLAAKGKHCMLAYKRIDAKIAWPTATQPIYN